MNIRNADMCTHCTCTFFILFFIDLIMHIVVDVAHTMWNLTILSKSSRFKYMQEILLVQKSILTLSYALVRYKSLDVLVIAGMLLTLKVSLARIPNNHCTCFVKKKIYNSPLADYHQLPAHKYHLFCVATTED